MASILPGEPLARPDAIKPELGQILVVIHDFVGRSDDELSLIKGDRVELVERDDEFGDGWYYGRHLTNGSIGLFPEVYTRVAPRGALQTTAQFSSVVAPKPLAPNTVEVKSPINLDTLSQPVYTIQPLSPVAEQGHTTVSPNVDQESKPSQAAESTFTGSNLDISHASTIPPETQPPSSSNTAKEHESNSAKSISPASTPPPVLAMQPKTVAATKSHIGGQDSPVMNETLSVIEEHITDMKHPHHKSLGLVDRLGLNDSGSDYSGHPDHRMSYINGEETDEEENNTYTQEEVCTWTPDQVAEYLFTVGVEAKHCEIFRDQEITGDVLLGMDQATVFMKEFELGSVGRRLKTWQKIKVLQDEVKGISPSRRNTTTFSSEMSDDGTRSRSQSRSQSHASSTMLSKISNTGDRSSSRLNTRISQGHAPMQDSPISPMSNFRGSISEKRPSAASIRDLHHSRQNSIQNSRQNSLQSSANNFNSTSILNSIPTETEELLSGDKDTNHKKQASFDRDWTMGSAVSISGRPMSSAGIKSITPATSDIGSPSTIATTTFDSLDRGYFSGGEAEGRQRKVLRKKSSASHSRNSSLTDDQKSKSQGQSRHSRFGSVDSSHNASLSATQKYYGLSMSTRKRTPSESSVTAPPRPVHPQKEMPPPIVTRLEGSPSTPLSSGTENLQPAKLAPVGRQNFGLRAISDAVTDNEKTRVGSVFNAPASPQRDSPLLSPSRTGSSSPSGEPSLDLDSPESKTVGTLSALTSRGSSKKKSKKDTSAYQRGLEKKTPQEQMVDADFSGWMKKKSTNLMTTWKPRLFILKGRRLSYYYSENDEEEKGLIDISFHRVLPADNDRLTGLHATLTGAMSSPTSPSGAANTIASIEAAAEPESTLSKGQGDSMFIFKLVPPRAGLASAVTFTKQTVHYFAVPNVKLGRLWMAALMKATIDRDDSKPIASTYQQKTISLAKARAMRHRPPALMNLDEDVSEEVVKTPTSDKAGLNLQGIIYDTASQPPRSSHEPDAVLSDSSRSGKRDSEANPGTL